MNGFFPGAGMEDAMQIVVLILTCLASTPQEDCTRQKAIDIREVRAPATACALAGLATAASDPRRGIGLFTKIICGRPGQGEAGKHGDF
jgi:hypothetical protein